MSKPSILLIPGAFSLPGLYDLVVNAVAEKGYDIRALHLPSVAPKAGPKEGQLPTMYDDATFIAQEIQKLVDDDKNVILVSHSYGGIPATESTKGLGKEERQKQGKKGGIVNLAYMNCLIPDVGTAASGVLAGIPMESQSHLNIDVRGWMYHELISKAAEIAFSDIPKEEGEALVKEFTWHSSASFAGELTYAGYKDIPVSYLLCEEDLVIPVNIQRVGIELIEKVSGKNVDVTSIKFGHCPTVSAPQKVTDWILHVAKKV